MSHFDYEESKVISGSDPGFYSLIMAAIRKADGINLAKLIGQWPEVYAEFSARYDAPGGYLEGETP